AAFGAADEHDRLRSEAASVEIRSRVAALMGVGIDEIGESTETVGMPPGDRPPEWWLRTAALSMIGGHISERLFIRRWDVLSFQKPCMVTSDRPIVLYRVGNGDGEPTGLEN